MFVLFHQKNFIWVSLLVFKFSFLLQRGGKDTSQSEESEGSVVDSEAESVAESRVTRRSAAGKKHQTCNWNQKGPSPGGSNVNTQ